MGAELHTTLGLCLIATGGRLRDFQGKKKSIVFFKTTCGRFAPFLRSNHGGRVGDPHSSRRLAFRGKEQRKGRGTTAKENRRI
ncbi:MAG: hypothetical protein RLZZ399_1601 [Verrucomicrobiota bacterium]|jgi:hypothetical protein